ncbi:MAG: CBS domain-containing protein [Pseudomonadota bacterium]
MIIRTVGEVVAGRELATVQPSDTVEAACKVLATADVGALAVVEGDQLVGVISERDVIQRAICRGRPTADTAVSDVMTPDPKVIGRGASLSEALTQMIEGRFRHLPVVEAGAVTAMLSIRDIPTEYRLMVERYREYTEPA